MSDTYGVTRSIDLHGMTAERIAFLAGAMDPALQLPWFFAKPTKALQTEFYPTESPGPHRRKTQEGVAPNPRRLKKGQAVTYTKITLENVLALSRLAQIGMDASVGELELLAALGNSAGWGVHIECVDFMANDAYTLDWSDGVPFFSGSHPSEVGLFSNRLESALDNAALTAAIVMLAKQRGHDGQFVGQDAGWVLTPSDLGPSAWQLVQPTTTSPTPGASAVAGPSYVGARGLSVVSSPAIDDTDCWQLVGKNFKLEAFVADPSNPKVEGIVGTRDRIASDELTFILGARGCRGVIGCGPA